MSKLNTLAKATAAFLVVAVGISFIVGSLMGGGFGTHAKNYAKGRNSDPRSVLVQTVLIESTQSRVLPAAGAVLDAREFEKILAEADALRGSDAAWVRSPSLLVQHDETGVISLGLADRTFAVSITPRVIGTETGPILRVALELEHVSGSGESDATLSFATVFTTAPGAAVVLDLAGLVPDGSRTTLALRTALIDPTPPRMD